MKKLSCNTLNELLEKYKLFLLNLLVYILFRGFFENIISVMVVQPFLSKFEVNYITSIIGIVVAILFIGYSFRKKTEEVSDTTVFVSIIVLAFWFYYRLFNPVWSFYYPCKGCIIAYIDIVPLICSCFILRRIVYKKKIDNKEVESVGNLYAIHNKCDDLLNRAVFAKQIAQKIKESNNAPEAFSIGIESAWGNGKTSFLNLVEKELKNQETIIIHFNPWIYPDKSNIVEAFFYEVSHTIKSDHRKLATEFLLYSRKLEGFSSTLSGILSVVSSFVCVSSLQEQFKLINDHIKKTKKQIVVFVDDLDRLDYKEIVEILKLIRTSSNFNNMVFLVAYDRSYVVNAISKINSCKSNTFLEKIFQFEYVLPKISHDLLVKKVISEIEKDISSEEDKKRLKLAYKENFKGSQFLYTKLSNLRDVYRFVEHFRLKFKKLKDEVDIIDLMNIELLSLKYPEVYHFLADNWKAVLFETRDIGNTSRYLLSMKNFDLKKQKTSNQLVSANKLSIEKYIEQNPDRFNLSTLEMNDALDIINNLFSQKTGGSLLKSIRYPGSIERYFYDELLSSDLSVSEFDEVIATKNIPEIKGKIKEWCLSKSIALKERLQKVKLKNYEDYKLHVCLVIYFCCIEKTFKCDESHVTWLIDKDFPNKKEDKKNFIKNILKENGLGTYVPEYLDRERNNIHALNATDILEITMYYFKLALESKSINPDIFSYLSYTANNDGLISADAVALFLAAIKKEPAFYLPLFIEKVPNNPDDRYYIINLIKIIRKGEISLKDFVIKVESDLKSNENSLSIDLKIIQEVLDLIRIEGVYDNSKGVKFNFKYIKL